MVLQCNNLKFFPIVEFFPFWTAKKVQYLFSFYIFTLLKLERGNDDTNGTVAGLCGPATFVMSVIGAEMMMEVMVCVSILLFTLTFFPFSPQLNFPLFFFKLCLGAVVLFRSREHENCGPQPGFVRAHIESNLQIVFFFYDSDWKEISLFSFIFFLSVLFIDYYIYVFHFGVITLLSCLGVCMCGDVLRWRIQYFPAQISKR